MRGNINVSRPYKKPDVEYKWSGYRLCGPFESWRDDIDTFLTCRTCGVDIRDGDFYALTPDLKFHCLPCSQLPLPTLKRYMRRDV